MQNEKIKIPAWVALEADVLVCKKLTNTEKVLYAIIAALSNNSKKKCFANNSYFAKMLNIKNREVQYCLKKLYKLKFIDIKYDDNNNRRSITTVVNSFLEYRKEKLQLKFNEYQDILEYDWLNEEFE